MQVASDERKNIIMDDADIPAGLDRLDLILEADAKRGVERDAIAEIKQRLDNIDAMIAYILNTLDDSDLDYDDPDPYAAEALGDDGDLPETPDVDDPLIDDPDYEDPDAVEVDPGIDHLNDDPHANVEIPPPDGWDPDADDVLLGVGLLPRGLDPAVEHWRITDDFPNYEVGTWGSVRTAAARRVIAQELSSSGYPRVSLYRLGVRYRVFVHRLVAKTWIPNPDDKPEVDHIDRNKQNNVLHNLRWVTREENMQNRGRQRNNTTGVTGVTRVRDGYRAYITANKRRRNLGTFATLEEAAEARRRAEAER